MCTLALALKVALATSSTTTRARLGAGGATGAAQMFHVPLLFLTCIPIAGNDLITWEPEPIKKIEVNCLVCPLLI